MTLTRKPSGWWPTITVDESVAPATTEASPVVGVDVGIANFTTSTGKRYGMFHGKLAQRHRRDRQKRQRKAKLRACLKKKGVERRPSLTNQRLARHVRQEINRAVNLFYEDRTGYQVAYEALNVRGMRFHAKRMNAYLYASNLGHIPKQLAWKARKHGQTARGVWAGAGFPATLMRTRRSIFGRAFTMKRSSSAGSKEEVKALLDQRHRIFLNGCP